MTSLPVSDDLSEWTQAVGSDNKAKLMSLKGEIYELLQEAGSVLGHFMHELEPMEIAFHKYMLEGPDAESVSTVLTQLPVLAARNMTDVSQSLDQMAKWFEKRIPVQVTPTTEMRDTINAGHLIVWEAQQTLKNIVEGLHAARELQKELEESPTKIGKSEKMGRLAVAYYSKAGNAQEGLSELGRLVIVIINIGGVND